MHFSMGPKCEEVDEVGGGDMNAHFSNPAVEFNVCSRGVVFSADMNAPAKTRVDSLNLIGLALALIDPVGVGSPVQLVGSRKKRSTTDRPDGGGPVRECLSPTS